MRRPVVLALAGSVFVALAILVAAARAGDRGPQVAAGLFAVGVGVVLVGLSLRQASAWVDEVRLIDNELL